MKEFSCLFLTENQAEVIEAFNSTSRRMDAFLNIDNNFLTVCSIKFTHQSFI